MANQNRSRELEKATAKTTEFVVKQTIAIVNNRSSIAYIINSGL